MSESRLGAVAAWGVLLAMVPFSGAQQAGSRIGYVYPAGGRQGSTFRVTVGGQRLQGVEQAHVSGEGVSATVVEHIRPLNTREMLMLRDKLKELMDRKAAAGEKRPGRAPAATAPAWTPDDEKALADVRKKLAGPRRKEGNPAIEETVILEVTVAPEARPGRRDLRLRAPPGLTNPLAFCVGQLPEFREDPPRADNPGPPMREMRRARPPQAGTTEVETRITLPATVNGQILPGDVDRFRFKARKGRLVVAVNARTLIPYLADAVPGWFQATLALHDSGGRELAYDDDFRFHPDPVLSYQIPRDGEYVIEIKDSIYRGREDFVYRIDAGELPFVTGIFPLGGRSKVDTAVHVEGWNLPASILNPHADGERDVLQLTVRQGDLLSNQVPFAVDTLPEILEKEPNDRPGEAQPVTLPVIINGRVGAGGDGDLFRFDGRAGQEIVAEILARRLGSPLDGALRLTDAAGRQLAFNDDHEDKAAGLDTHHADSYLRIALPADGTFNVHLGDTQNKGGAEYAYRLRIGAPRPDYELRVVPSSVNVRAGATVPLTVHALRKDGFTGEIALTLKGAPAGFSLAGARIPADQDQARITLAAPPRPREGLVRLSLEGRARIRDRDVARPVVPAENLMQAFAYHHLVPSHELVVAVLGRWTQRRPMNGSAQGTGQPKP